MEENKKETKQRDIPATQSKTEHVIRSHKKPSSSHVRPPHKNRTEGDKKGEKETRSRHAPSTSSSYYSRRREAPRKREYKNPSPLPELGQPGGRDDLMRQGLSGAGVKWYLRYLRQGLAPEEARKKAVEHKTQGLEQTIQPEDKKRKRDETNITPQKQEPKRRKAGKSTATTTGGSYAAALKTEKIAILPKAFPETTLSTDEQTLLEEAIVEEMCAGWEHKLQFGGIHFRPGMILVDCETPQSAEWVRTKVPQLKSWKGVELMVCAGDDIPKVHTITIFLPRSQNMTEDKLLKLIEAQNEELRTSQWKVISLKEEGTGQILRAGIDDLSCQRIKDNGFTIHYRFGKIPVHGLRKNEERKEKEKEGKVEEVTPNTPEEDVESTGSPHISILCSGETTSEATMEVEEVAEEDRTLTGGDSPIKNQEDGGH